MAFTFFSELKQNTRSKYYAFAHEIDRKYALYIIELHEQRKRILLKLKTEFDMYLCHVNDLQRRLQRNQQELLAARVTGSRTETDSVIQVEEMVSQPVTAFDQHSSQQLQLQQSNANDDGERAAEQNMNSSMQESMGVDNEEATVTEPAPQHRQFRRARRRPRRQGAHAVPAVQLSSQQVQIESVDAPQTEDIDNTNADANAEQENSAQETLSRMEREIETNPIWTFSEMLNFHPDVMLSLPEVVRNELIPAEFQNEVETYLTLYQAQVTQRDIRIQEQSVRQENSSVSSPSEHDDESDNESEYQPSEESDGGDTHHQSTDTTAEDIRDRFKCKLCGKQAQNKSALKMHQRVHDGKKPFQCPICLARFGYKSSMNQHIRNQHEQPKNYECKYCAKRFSTNTGRKSHEARKHNDEESTRWICSICQKHFYGRRDYVSHQQKAHKDDN